MGESFALRTPIINSSPLYLEMSVIVASSVGAECLLTQDFDLDFCSCERSF
jgi:hypothetical protein